ncbi:hypothetical protein Q3G72_012781 [Acer saccharum]|nr:hypothetical protein Q3G72_012781 [Acer saccharum]
MAGEGDYIDSRYSQGLPDNELLEEDTALNATDATLTTADQSTAIAGFQRFPLTSEDIAQRFRASLQQLISDAAKQGVNLSTTKGLTSSHNLLTPNQQPGQLHSIVVAPTPDAPLKMGQNSTDQPETLSKRQARDSMEHRGEDYSSRRGTIRLHGLNRGTREQEPKGRRQKLTISQGFNSMGEPEGDRDILIQSLTREVQNNRQQMDALVRRYGRNKLSDDESSSPFTNGILRMPFPERFRMPHVEQFKKDTDPKEHVRRLPTASISSFRELSKVFSRQFLGNVHRNKSVAHLSQLKQGKDESLKKYLGRFGQEVSEIGSANDEAIVVAFINNLQNSQLFFDLRRARLTSYADMIDMAGGYALTEEEKLQREVILYMVGI